METTHCMWRLLVLVSVGSLTSGQYFSYDSDILDTMQDMAEDRHTYMMHQRLYGGSGTQYNTQGSYAAQQRPAYQYNYQSAGQNGYGRNTNAYGTNNYGYGRNTNAYGVNNNANGGSMYQQNAQQQPRNYQQNGGYNNLNTWSPNGGSYQQSQSSNNNNGVNSQPSNSPVSSQNYLQKNQGGSLQKGSVNNQGYQQQAFNSATNGQPSQSFNNNQQSQQIQTKCSQVMLDRSNGRSAVNVPGAVIGITLIQQTQWSRCTSASFGFIGRYAYVGNGCSGNFKVCYQ